MGSPKDCRKKPPTSGRRVYVLVGKRIHSVNDGDVHYVGPQRLLDLYGLRGREAECVMCQNDEEVRAKTLGMNPAELVFLYPRFLGDYRLPDEPTDGRPERPRTEPKLIEPRTKGERR